MEGDDIIRYHALVTEEKAALQRGKNFAVGKKYSVFLTSLREKRAVCRRARSSHRHAGIQRPRRAAIVWLLASKDA